MSHHPLSCGRPHSRLPVLAADAMRIYELVGLGARVRAYGTESHPLRHSRAGHNPASFMMAVRSASMAWATVGDRVMPPTRLYSPCDSTTDAPRSPQVGVVRRSACVTNQYIRGARTGSQAREGRAATHGRRARGRSSKYAYGGHAALMRAAHTGVQVTGTEKKKPSPIP